MLRASTGGRTVQETIRKKLAWVAGLQGADRDLGRTSRAERHRVQYGWWRPAGMDVCLERRYKTVIRVENRVQRVVQLSIRVTYGKGELGHGG